MADIPRSRAQRSGVVMCVVFAPARRPTVTWPSSWIRAYGWMAMLFTPSDFNSSSVFSISGDCHSMPQVWQETVMPL